MSIDEEEAVQRELAALVAEQEAATGVRRRGPLPPDILFLHLTLTVDWLVLGTREEDKDTDTGASCGTDDRASRPGARGARGGAEAGGSPTGSCLIFVCSYNDKYRVIISKAWIAFHRVGYRDVPWIAGESPSRLREAARAKHSWPTSLYQSR